MKPVSALFKPKEGAFSRTFRHFGSSEAWSLRAAIFAIATLAAVSFLTDSVLTSNFNPVWALVSVAAFIPPILISYCYHVYFIKRRPEKSRPFLNLFVAGLAGSSRNVSVGILALITDLDPTQRWIFRLVGGFVAGVTIFAIWAISQGTTIEYLESMRRLKSIQDQLADFRQDLPDVIEEINETLIKNTKISVLPQLDKIARTLGSPSSKEQAVFQLRQTISTKIKPILNDMVDSAPLPFKELDFKKLTKSRNNIPERYKLYESLNVIGASFAQSIGFSFWLIFVHGWYGLAEAFIGTCIYGFCFYTLKSVIRRDKFYAKSRATAATLAIAAISTGFNSLYLGTLDISGSLLITLTGLTLLSGLIAPLILSHSQIRHRRQAEIEAEISTELHKHFKENKLFSQNLWMFKKKWLLVLHGTVQSALTAAVTRLESAKTLDEHTVQLVNQDLLRAKRAFESKPQNVFNFEHSITDLVQLWRGICEIQIQISERARRVINKKPNIAFLINEIAKDSISNAVRHGSASAAEISIDRIKDDLVHLEVSNNGSKPKSPIKPGVGFRMLDDVCLNWSLEFRDKNTVLSAELPFRL